MRKLVLLGLLLALVVPVMASPSVGDIITVNTYTLTPKSNGISIQSDVRNGTYNLGQFNLKTTAGVVMPAFCIDLYDGLVVPTTYEVVMPEDAPEPVGNNMGAAKAADLNKLWGLAYASIGNDGVKAAAFQVAVWEIVYEDGEAYDVTVGSGSDYFKITNRADVAAIANGWLAGLANATPTGLVALTSTIKEDSQDMITPAPAPGAILLGSLGMGFVGYLRRRRSL